MSLSSHVGSSLHYGSDGGYFLLLLRQKRYTVLMHGPAPQSKGGVAVWAVIMGVALQLLP